MKAITISQPWADLIRNRDKFVENRHWPTSHRGQLAIHAGKGTQYLGKAALAGYTTGAVVAIADMVACLHLVELRKMPLDLEIEDTPYTVGQILDHTFTEGPYLWVFNGTTAIKPVVVPGKQGLWVWEYDETQIVEDVDALSEKGTIDG